MSEGDKTQENDVQWVAWDALAPHAMRGVLLIVAPDLDLAAVGRKVAEDDTAAIGKWIADERIFKPTPAMIQQWQGEDGLFSFVIVQPYVLCQKPKN